GMAAIAALVATVGAPRWAPRVAHAWPANRQAGHRQTGRPADRQAGLVTVLGPGLCAPQVPLRQRHLALAAAPPGAGCGAGASGLAPCSPSPGTAKCR